MTTTWQFTPLVLPVLGAALLTGTLTAYLVRRRRALGADWLLALLASVTFWALVYGLEVLAVERSLKLFMAQLKYLGIVAVPVAWLGFTLIYTGRARLITRQRLLAAALLPALIGLLAVTNEAHEWVWRDATVRSDGPFAAVTVTYLPLFWLHTVYAYAMLGLGLALLVGLFRRARGVMRKQAGLMLIGAVVPFAGNAVSLVAGDALGYLDLTPVGFTVSGLCFAWEFLRLRLLDLLPRIEPAPRVTLDTDVESALARTRSNILDLLISGTLVLGLVTVIPAVIRAIRQPRIDWLQIAIFTGAYAVVLIVFFARRLSYTARAASFALVWFLFGVCSTLLFGLESDAGITMFAFVLFTYLLFGTRWSLAALGLMTVALVVLSGLLLTGVVTVSRKYVAGGAGLDLVAGIFIYALASGVAIIAIYRLQRGTVQLIVQSGDLSARLEKERALLESRVSNRTRALEATFAISRLAGSRLGRAALVQRATAEIRQAFAFHHVALYRYASGRLVLETGEAPANHQRHRPDTGLTMGQGLPGRAATTRAPALAADTRRDDRWQGYPLLAETRSELSVPILLGDRLLGVLDLQSRSPNAFDEATISQMQSIASQLAVALRNDEIHQEVQQQARMEAQLTAIGQAIHAAGTSALACQLAVRELGRALDPGHAWVRLTEPAPADGMLLGRTRKERLDHEG